MRRRKILFIPLSDGLAHITRCLCIADLLDRSRYHIRFAVGVDRVDFVHKAGYGTYSFSPSTSLDITKEYQFVRRQEYIHFLRRCFEEDLSSIRKFQPDVVITDKRVTACISTRLMDIPWVTIVNSIYLPEFWNGNGFDLSDAKTLNRLYYLIGRFYVHLILRRVNYIPFHRISNQFEKASLYMQFEADLKLVADIPEYISLGSINADTHFVGPLFWEGFEKQEPPWFKEIDSARPIIYLTFGGTVYHRELYLKCIRAFEGTPYQLLVSLGPNFRKKDFGILPKNVWMENFLPGQKICRMSNLVICHGGHGTIMQALKYGKPLVIIPYQYGHFYNAKRLVHLQCGVNLVPLKPTVLTPKGLLRETLAISEEKIRQSADLVMKDRRYQENAARMSEKIKPYGNGSAAIPIIEEFLDRVQGQRGRRQSVHPSRSLPEFLQG